MSVASELVNVLGFRLEGEENLRKFKREMDQAEREAKQHEKRFTAVGNKIGMAIGGAAIIAGATVKKAYGEFAEFERSMTRIGVTAGASRQQISEITDGMYQMANQFALPIEAVRAGLDTLTASGMSLEEAMAFLPSVLTTAQASGAAVEDIANTAVKASSALKISTGDLQNMFDILNTGGKLGQFELRDMASYIPSLANQFAALGYKGTDGTRRLVAMLQTLREDTGTAEEAATNAGEIFGKMLAPGQINNFKKNFKFDIEGEMKKATNAGEDVLEAYVRLSREALGGDLSKIGQLFTDKQMRLGMISLLTSGEEWQSFLSKLDGADVAGSTMRDLNVVLQDQEAILQRLGNRWDSFMKNLGAKVAPAIGGALDFGNRIMDDDTAINAALKARGYSEWGAFAKKRTMWSFEKPELIAEGRRILEGKSPQPLNAPGGDSMVARREPPKPVSSVVPGGRDFTDPTMVPRSDASGAYGVNDNRMSAIASMLQGMDSRLAEMTGQAPIDANITDARTDARSFPVTVNSSVVQNIQQPSAAPGAVGAATNAAVSSAVQQQAARIQAEPAQ